MTANITNKSKEYWTKRAESYSKINQEELCGSQKENWGKEIQKEIKKAFGEQEKSTIHILDVGTGPGFFAIILAEMGYQVTGIDLNEEMIAKAIENAGNRKADIQFIQMDGQKPSFQKESFHVVISRNLTWVLEKPKEAYASWIEMLKPGGLLLNFDANWYAYLYDEELRKGYTIDRNNVAARKMEDHYEGTDIEAMEEIARNVPLTILKRPNWDREVLQKLHLYQIDCDEKVGNRVLSTTEKLNYGSTPIFKICARKKR